MRLTGRIEVALTIDIFTIVMFFFYKQKTAYEMRISDWSSDVCSSDLHGRHDQRRPDLDGLAVIRSGQQPTSRTRDVAGTASAMIARSGRSAIKLGRASCRERVCQYV